MESNGSSEEKMTEQVEDENLKKKDKKKKARLRTRGPYRKAHVDW